MMTPSSSQSPRPQSVGTGPEHVHPPRSSEAVLQELERGLEARTSLVERLLQPSAGSAGHAGRSADAVRRLTPQQLMAQRAEQLAQKVEDTQDEGGITILVLQVGDERYGIEVHEALEILVLSRLTPLPGVVGYWAGLINLRGRLFPVLDLASFLGLGSTPLQPGARAVLVGRDDLCMGLLVASASTVVQVTRSQLGPSMSSTLGIGRDLIRGVTRDSVSLLSVDALLSDPRLEVQDDVN